MNIGINDPIHIAKSFAPYELRGWLKKSISIPYGKVGIVLFKDGRKKLLPSGKSLLLNPVSRLRGDGIGMLVGYFHDGPFDLNARFDNLLTGDDELLDVQLVLNLEVSDPSIFFTKMVVPIRHLEELPGYGIQPVRNTLARIFAQYEREDLLYHIPTENLIGELYVALSKLTPEFGARLHAISYLFMTRSEDRLIVGDKFKQFATTHESKQNEQFIDKVDDYDPIKEVGMSGVFSIRSNEKKALSEILRDIKNSRIVEKSKKVHWLLWSLKGLNTEEMDEKDIGNIRYWRALEFRWVFAFLTIGAVTTYFLYRSSIDFNNAEMTGLLVGIWGSIITLIINRLKKIVEKQEYMYSLKNSWASEENIIYINDRDKKEVDELVRRQCTNELTHVQEVMNNARKTVYDAGNSDLALKIKELEQKIEAQRNRYLSPDNNSPFYVSGTPIKESEWNMLLDKEEETLILVKNFGEMAEKFRLLLPEVSAEDLRKVEQYAEKLENQMYARSRLV
jgi:hypothetical protein